MSESVTRGRRSYTKRHNYFMSKGLKNRARSHYDGNRIKHQGTPATLKAPAVKGIPFRIKDYLSDV